MIGGELDMEDAVHQGAGHRAHDGVILGPVARQDDDRARRQLHLSQALLGDERIESFLDLGA